MKGSSTTIWESASRPLFVRSVWLDTANAGGAYQRHFLLDYEPRQLQQLHQQRQLKSAVSSQHSRRRQASLISEGSMSYDFIDINATNSIDEASAEDNFVIDSAKVKLHQQHHQHQQHIKPQQYYEKAYRRPSFLAKKPTNYESFHSRRNSDVNEHYSRRSSLQDVQSTLSMTCSFNPDERLAERVLNWLDLAGKNTGDLTNHANDNDLINSMETKQKKSIKNSVQNNKQLAKSAHTRAQAIAAAKPSSSSQAHSSQHNRKASSQSKNHHSRRPDSVKHITIIFNRDGIPVRFNRPARNIDLCALASSPNTTRRLAGPLASTRLYNSVADRAAPTNIAGGFNAAAGDNKSVKHSTNNSSSRHWCNFEDTNKSFQRRLQEERTFYDAKKQLHIFMPSLPKKSLFAAHSIMSNSGSAGGVGGGHDDSASGFSNTFSELCKI